MRISVILLYALLCCLGCSKSGPEPPVERTNAFVPGSMRHYIDQMHQQTNLLDSQLHQSRRQTHFLLYGLIAVTAAWIATSYYQRRQQRKMRHELKQTEWELRDQIERLERANETSSRNEQAAWLREQLFRQLVASEKIPALRPVKGESPGKHKRDRAAISRFTGNGIKDVEKQLDETIWSGFADRLQAAYPLLKKGEVHFCCLIRSGLTTTELAAVYCISQSAVTQRKVRIKINKMDIHNDPRSLDSILAEFDTPEAETETNEPKAD